jgi:hypothetical protein
VQALTSQASLWRARNTVNQFMPSVDVPAAYSQLCSADTKHSAGWQQLCVKQLLVHVCNSLLLLTNSAACPALSCALQALTSLASLWRARKPALQCLAWPQVRYLAAHPATCAWMQQPAGTTHVHGLMQNPMQNKQEHNATVGGTQHMPPTQSVSAAA